MLRSKVFRYLQSTINFILLLSIGSLDAYMPPPPNIPMHIVNNVGSPNFCIQDGQAVSYEEILALLTEIEENDLESRCTPDELFKINCFVAHLARKGFLPGEEGTEAELEYDIQILLDPHSSRHNGLNFMHRTENGYALNAYFPSMAHAGAHKNWFSKQWDNTKKFVKQHKTAIIVGAILVVTFTVVVAVYVAGSSVAAGAVAGISALNDEFSPDSNEPSQGYTPEHSIDNQSLGISYFDEEYSPASLQDVIDEHVLSFKEMVVEDNLLPTHIEQKFSDRSLLEKTKELGAFLAHETLEGISQVVGFVPQVLNDINDLGKQLGFSDAPHGFLSNGNNPLENYQNLVASAHKKLDQICSTKLANKYISRLDGNGSSPNFTLGTLPPPGAPVPTIGRIPPTQASSTWGWKVGQPIVNRTAFGRIPKWDTVRARYWKERAQWAKSNPGHKYGDHNISRMERGLAPQEFNEATRKMESTELHHIPPRREGGLFDFIEVSPAEHATLDDYRRLKK